MGNLMMSF